MENNEGKKIRDLGLLDIFNLLSYYAQMVNIDMDNEHNEYIRLIIKAIAREIDLLHKENDKIIKQNEEILRLLKKWY